jgi:hypothetical protein
VFEIDIRSSEEIEGNQHYDLTKIKETARSIFGQYCKGCCGDLPCLG